MDSVNVPCLFVEQFLTQKMHWWQGIRRQLLSSCRRKETLIVDSGTKDSSGKTTKIDATAEQLTGRFMIDAFNEKLEREVYQPAYIALKNSL